MANLLPPPVIIALLRVLRHKPLQEDDEDILFDQFDVLGNQQVIVAAAAHLLDGDGGDGIHRPSVDARDRALDALLVDMLRQHKHNRDHRHERETDSV